MDSSVSTLPYRCILLEFLQFKNEVSSYILVADFHPSIPMTSKLSVYLFHIVSKPQHPLFTSNAILAYFQFLIIYLWNCSAWNILLSRMYSARHYVFDCRFSLSKAPVPLIRHASIATEYDIKFLLTWELLNFHAKIYYLFLFHDCFVFITSSLIMFNVNWLQQRHPAKNRLMWPYSNNWTWFIL